MGPKRPMYSIMGLYFSSAMCANQLDFIYVCKMQFKTVLEMGSMARETVGDILEVSLDQTYRKCAASDCQ
jgi:hypothetical protein